MTHLKKTLVAAAACLSALAAMAAPTTSGSMTREAGSDVIADSLNHRDWLGADVTKGLTYAQTLDATGVGGIFAGYTIAQDADAQMFQLALMGAAAGCAETGWGWVQCATSASANARTVFGESYYDYSQWGSSYDYNYMWFLADASYGGNQVGLLEQYSDAGTSTLSLLHSWSGIGSADYYAGMGSNSIGWLLYREETPAADVPEPGSLPLAALAGVGLWAAGRKRPQGLKLP